jgi:hypothetical protein
LDQYHPLGKFRRGSEQLRVCPQPLGNALCVIQPIDGKQDLSSFIARNPFGTVPTCSLVISEQGCILFRRDTDGEGFEVDYPAPKATSLILLSTLWTRSSAERNCCKCP